MEIGANIKLFIFHAVGRVLLDLQYLCLAITLPFLEPFPCIINITIEKTHTSNICYYCFGGSFVTICDDLERRGYWQRV